MTTAANFTPDAYRLLVETILRLGYEVRGFADAEPDARHLILRHDIDMAPDAALPMAGEESTLGVAATYFVLVRSEMYNPFAAAARAALDRILELGHDVGLHFDAALYADDDALEDAAEAECTVLETITGRPISTISFHRPAKSLLGREGTIAGRLHAYQPRYYSEMGYCSDSRGGWHHGAPLDHPAIGDGKALQLLTHPIWWTAPAAAAEARLDRLLEGKLKKLDRELATHCSVHTAGRNRLDWSEN